MIKKKRGFATMTKDEIKKIARKGGLSHSKEHLTEIGRKGGIISGMKRAKVPNQLTAGDVETSRD